MRALTARALGRVLVHEIVHALSPELAHTESGIFAAQFTQQTLLAQDIELDELSTAALRSGVARRAQLAASRR